MKGVPKSQVFQLLSVAAITSSIIVKPKQKVKANKDYCKTYWEKKGDEYKIKDAERKRSDQEKRKYLDPKKHDEIKKKGAAQIKEYRLKKKLAEQFACDSQKETEEEWPSTLSSFSLKQILNQSMKKAERSPSQPTKNSRSHW